MRISPFLGRARYRARGALPASERLGPSGHFGENRHGRLKKPVNSHDRQKLSHTSCVWPKLCTYIKYKSGASQLDPDPDPDEPAECAHRAHAVDRVVRLTRELAPHSCATLERAEFASERPTTAPRRRRTPSARRARRPRRSATRRRRRAPRPRSAPWPRRRRPRPRARPPPPSSAATRWPRSSRPTSRAPRRRSPT